MTDSFGLKNGLEGKKEFKAALVSINQMFKVLGDYFSNINIFLFNITKVFSNIIFVWLGYILLTGIFIGFGIWFQNKKRNYLLNNYKEFNCYEVTLDNFAPSPLYKQYVYYKVKIDDNGTIKTINTNPYFSNSPITKFSPAEYNGKKVVGLYDRKYNNFTLH